MADAILSLFAVSLCAGLLWGYQERRIKELKEQLKQREYRYNILMETFLDTVKQKKEVKKMAPKVTPPKGGSTSASAGKNSGGTKPPKGNQNPTIRKGG